jgi:hypothetical protein
METEIHILLISRPKKAEPSPIWNSSFATPEIHKEPSSTNWPPSLKICSLLRKISPSWRIVSEMLISGKGSRPTVAKSGVRYWWKRANHSLTARQRNPFAAGNIGPQGEGGEKVTVNPTFEGWKLASVSRFGSDSAPFIRCQHRARGWPLIAFLNYRNIWACYSRTNKQRQKQRPAIHLEGASQHSATSKIYREVVRDPERLFIQREN